MSHIQVKSSLALDTLCFLETRLMNDTKMKKRTIEEIRYINDFLPSDFGDSFIWMSKMCLIVSAYVDGDLENLTLDDLIDIFKDAQRVETTVKERIKGGFTASYIYPVLESLKNGFADLYVKKLTVLKNIGFENIYKERIMPMVCTEAEQKKKEVAGYDSDMLFRNISVMKKASAIGSASIYISFFSGRTSFTLYEGSFLSCFYPAGAVDYYSLVAHELMHGFADKKLISLYWKYIESNEKLKAYHRALVEDWQSGDEEEFVLAAEHYLCYLSGNYSKEQLLERAKKEYGGNCPTSIAIFELLLQELQVPEDYNKWLIKQFDDNKLSFCD